MTRANDLLTDTELIELTGYTLTMSALWKSYEEERYKSARHWIVRLLGKSEFLFK